MACVAWEKAFNAAWEEAFNAHTRQHAKWLAVKLAELRSNEVLDAAHYTDIEDREDTKEKALTAWAARVAAVQERAEKRRRVSVETARAESSRQGEEGAAADKSSKAGKADQRKADEVAKKAYASVKTYAEECAEARDRWREARALCSALQEQLRKASEETDKRNAAVQLRWKAKEALNEEAALSVGARAVQQTKQEANNKTAEAAATATAKARQVRRPDTGSTSSKSKEVRKVWPQA